MDPKQFEQLLVVLGKLSEKQYTLTGAADWPMLVICGGCLGGMLVALICFMWKDLSGKIDGYKTDNEKSHDLIWKSQQECQKECCPRGKEK